MPLHFPPRYAGPVEYVDYTPAEEFEPLNEATCWLWVVTCNAWGQILVAEWSVMQVLRGHVTCNTPLRSLLRLDKWLEMPYLLNPFVISSSRTCIIKAPNVTYWPSIEPSIKRCTCVNKQKNGEAGASGQGCRNITLTCGCGWIRCRCMHPREAGRYQTII